MSKGIVRLICNTDKKVASVLLSDNIINFDYEYAGKLYEAYETSFRLNSNDLIVDDTRPEGYITLNNPPKYHHFEGNVRGYFASINEPLEVK